MRRARGVGRLPEAAPPPVSREGRGSAVTHASLAEGRPRQPEEVRVLASGCDRRGGLERPGAAVALSHRKPRVGTSSRSQDKNEAVASRRSCACARSAAHMTCTRRDTTRSRCAARRMAGLPDCPWGQARTPGNELVGSQTLCCWSARPNLRRDRPHFDEVWGSLSLRWAGASSSRPNRKRCRPHLGKLRLDLDWFDQIWAGFDRPLLGVDRTLLRSRASLGRFRF